MGNFQGDFQAFTNRTAIDFQRNAQESVDKAVRTEIENSGVKFESDPRMLVDFKGETSFDGKTQILGYGTAFGDAKLAAISQKMRIQDEMAKHYEKALGNPRLKGSEQVKEHLKNTLDSILENTKSVSYTHLTLPTICSV